MKKNIPLLLTLILLMLLSLINNYSAKYISLDYDNYFIKQLIWYIVGFFIIFIINKINLNYLFKYSFWLYLFGNLLLIITLFWGVNVNGSNSWLSLGFINFQPSELVKVILIIYLYSFSKKYIYLSNLKYILLTSLIILIPSILTFLEPDTGAILIYIIIYISFLISRNLNRWWYILGIILIVLVIGSFLVLYYFFQDTFINIFGTTFFYRMDRITDFINGEGYQINKALIAIGSAGLFGRGIRNIPEYFPEAPTDFAFTLLINNIGLIGAVIFLIVYFYFIYLIINKYYLNKKLILPIILLLMIQFSINVLMNIGLLPIIGITLPFISYGGSSLISYMILIGLVINVKSIK
ncbi:MAG: FtsW/RodA/SpoVE family cell cycle protein [Bacilli bacterium]|nr:FtsW/RodA/SpoVE family cell cycle protein [Bacilli bacterium]MDD3895416.1 FtsW/RodA/SpoVE family cell cycle protein [Bacilli bacterium]MDD4407627.1 FtsW/RodA/SpoVE family cell cycle protein [Bacilli bacterium]